MTLRSLGDGRWEVEAAERKETLELRWREDRVLLLGDGMRIGLPVAVAGDRVWVQADGRTWALERARPVPRRGAGGGGGPDAGEAEDGSVRAVMPGTVVKLLVGEGDRVHRGQAVAVLEAMKIEHRLLAPRDGLVLRVRAVEGAHVALGASVLEVGADGAGDAPETA